MQRASSLTMHVEAPFADIEDSPQELRDLTPRFILFLPKCLQIVVYCLFAMLVGSVFFALVGPMTLLMALFVTPATRSMLRDFQEQSDIVEGRVVEQTKQLWKFLNSTSQGWYITVQYNVHEATYRKKFRMSQELHEELGLTLGNSVELFVIHGKPKSAMIKSAVEKSIATQSDERWKQLLAGLCFSIIIPVYLIVIFTHVSMFSWNTVLHGCVLGVVLFGVTVLLYWWWDPVTKQKHAFLESAERVGEDDVEADAFVPLDNHDSLTAPLLSAVTGL